MSAANDAGMTDEDRTAAVNTVAQDPTTGDLMKGTGGCRKSRLAGRGKGKSGGFRVITFFAGDNFPVFLLTVFGKGEKANLTKAECNELAKLTATLTDHYTKEPRR
ncbi:type II toxin-antitoxin system RelE/ParE family toxin [Caulobacter segnis]|uniref:type II toxin-antitoxin system RelE/ParE family toxin n=1 Tax=Caulobacter segnis TaxID=88688 RepID=UPI00240ECD78|nr:type II toxin-antitoxin system RelE/ParE family toxin [Caulobacter segnis]MDG2522586.1 type II toxin-antitoxin system RelE/ParE family toxin [Caulobacter segnis]